MPDRSSGIAPSELDTPVGWYAVAASSQLAPGSRQPVRLGGEDLVLIRTASGQARLFTAWCPHLGANLGHSGAIEGEQLVCGFHGFRFDVGGACVATGYGQRVPPRARLRSWPIIDVGGVLLAWYHPDGAPPSWQPPPVDTTGWTPMSWRRRTVASHPLETTENSVDLGHFAHLHGYDSVEQLSPLETDGPHLSARYGMLRRNRIPGLRLDMRTEFDVHVWGLGYSRVDLDIVTLGLRGRLLVLPTPAARGEVVVRLAFAMHRSTTAVTPRVVRMLPVSVLADIVRRTTILAVAHDVGQDAPMWETKRHLPSPMLAEGDGPIGAYRHWARQFFIDNSPQPIVVPAQSSRSVVTA